MKTTVIRKWGNSIAVRLPKDSARKFGLRDGVTVRLVEEEKTRSLSIRPLQSREYTLKELLSRVTPKNRHKLIDWGPPVGKETW